MKIAYTKLHQFKIFGLVIFEWATDYIENSTESDSEDDYLNISWINRKLK